MQLLVSDRPKYSKAGTVLILNNQYVHPGVLAPNGKFVLSNLSLSLPPPKWELRCIYCVKSDVCVRLRQETMIYCSHPTSWQLASCSAWDWLPSTQPHSGSSMVLRSSCTTTSPIILLKKNLVGS